MIRQLNSISLAHGLCIFGLIAGVNLTSALDPDLHPRFFVLSLSCLTFSIWMLFAGKKVIVEQRFYNLLVSAGVILCWTALRIYSSINSGEAVAEVLRLAVMYSVLPVSYILITSSENAIRVLTRCALLTLVIIAGFVVHDCLISIGLNRSDFRNVVNNISGGFANKNFLSESLLMLLPFYVTGAFFEKRVWKILFIVAIFLVVTAILIIQSLGSLLALIIAGIIFFILLLRNGIVRMRLPVFFSNKLLAVLLLLFLLTATVYLKESGVFHSIKSRTKAFSGYVSHPELLTQLRMENNNSTFERLVMLRNSLFLIADYPYFGAGINNWKILQPKYGMGGTLFINGGNVHYEHPHNDFLLILCEQGFAGLFLYLLFFFIIFRMIYKDISRLEERNKIIIIIFSCGVISFLFISFFSYPRSRIYPFVLLMVETAIICSMLLGNKEQIKKEMNYLPKVFFCLSVAATLISFSIVKSEIHGRNAVLAQLASNFPKMIYESDKADSWFSPLDITTTPFQFYSGVGRFYSGDLKSALSHYQRAYTMNPYHIRVINDLATCYEKNGDREMAIILYRKALSIIPDFIEGNLNLTAAYYNSGKIDSAYYCIDKLYGISLNYRDNNCYHTFLPAILRARKFEYYFNQRAKISEDSIAKLIPPDSILIINYNSEKSSLIN